MSRPPNGHQENKKSLVLPQTTTDVADDDRKRRYGTASKLSAAMAYGVVSTSITIFNKQVFAVYKFNYPATLTMIQICLTIILIVFMNCLGLEYYSLRRPKSLIHILPLTISWWIYVVSGVTSLRYLDVPMYSVLRRSTTLAVMLGELLMFRSIPSTSLSASVVLMVFGAALAGYLWVFICVVSTAVYLLLIRLLKESTGLTDPGLLFYNNVLALPLMGVYLVLGTDELPKVQHYEHIHSLKFQSFIAVSAAQAFLLNLCIFRCTTINSPLTTSITGQIKDIATLFLGYCLFDIPRIPMNILGTCIGLIGGLLYSYSSYRERYGAPKSV